MIDLLDPGAYVEGVPHERFRELRETAPVSWQPPGYWAVTTHRDVVAVLKQPKLFSSWLGGALFADPPAEFLAKLREGLLNRDPPDHTALRRFVNKSFSPRRIEQLESQIAAHAATLIAGIKERGACDFAMEVAGEMPLFAICQILGVPPGDRAQLYALTTRMLANEHPDPQIALRDGMAAAAELRAYGNALARDKRRSPDDDITSELVAGSLSEAEIEAFFMLLFNAGADTTRSLLCFGLDLLIDRPRITDWDVAIEELVRFESPVNYFRRTATQETDLAGATIQKGDKVLVFFPSANRDAAVFRDPDRLDLARAPNEHVAFGYGTHFCLGAPLARMECKHLFEQLFANVTDIERTGPIVRTRSSFIRSVKHQPIRYRAIP